MVRGQQRKHDGSLQFHKGDAELQSPLKTEGDKHGPHD